MDQIGKTMMIFGAILLGMGALLWFASRLPGTSMLGRLPGDVRVETGNTTIFAPFTTMILLSVGLSLLLMLVNAWRR